MALSASGFYCANFKEIINNNVAMDWLADANKVALVNNSATPNFDSDTTWTSANEVGTPTGGIALSTPTLTITTGSLIFDAVDTAWGSQSISNIYGAYIYDTTVSSLLWGLVYFGGTAYSVTSGVFTIQWHSSGIFAVDLTP